MGRTNHLRAVGLTTLAVLALGGLPVVAQDAATPPPGTPAPEARLPILGAVPNAPPRPPRPTPDPNATPPPVVTPPPAEVRDIMFYVDTVTAGPGESQYNVDADRYCTINSSFLRGMHIVWRLKAWDSSGTELQATDVETAVLQLPHGDEVNFRFGNHAGNWFWTAAWDVPPDYPLGAVDFTVEFTTNDGKTGTFKQIPVSNAERGIESRLNIVG